MSTRGKRQVEALLCTDGQPHEWHTAEGGFSCTECNVVVTRLAFKLRHDRLERALAIALREEATLQRRLEAADAVVEAAKKHVNAVRYQLEIENEPHTHHLLADALTALAHSEEAALPRDGAEFWSNFVYPEGASPEQIQGELTDYHAFMSECAKVYDHITRGRISKPNTLASAVIAVADEVFHDDLQEALAQEALAHKAR